LGPERKPGLNWRTLSATPFAKAATWICRTETERIIRGYKGLSKIKQRVNQAYLVLRQVCLLAAIGFFRSRPKLQQGCKNENQRLLGFPRPLAFAFTTLPKQGQERKNPIAASKQTCRRTR
jgi:hypothetical protein